MGRMRKMIVPAWAVICALAALLWFVSLVRSAEFGYAWRHGSRTPYHGSGYFAAGSSGGVILLGGGVVPTAVEPGWSFHAGPVIPYGSASESLAVRAGFGARGNGQWGDEFFDRQYLAPWWLVFLATAWAPVVLVRRRRGSTAAAAASEAGSSSSRGDEA